MIVTIKELKDDLNFDKKPCVSFLSDKDDKWRKADIKFKPLLRGTVELIYDRSGKYPVLTDVKPATVQEAVSQDKTSKFATFHEEQNRMDRRTCFMQACAVWGDTKDIAIILEKTDTALQYFTDGIRPIKNVSGWDDKNETAIQRAIEENTKRYSPKPTPTSLQQTTEAFEPSMSVKTLEDFKKSVNDFCRQHGWNKANLENFIKAHEKKLGGKTDVTTLDTTEQVILLTLLSKEAKNLK